MDFGARGAPPPHYPYPSIHILPQSPGVVGMSHIGFGIIGTLMSTVFGLAPKPRPDTPATEGKSKEIFKLNTIHPPLKQGAFWRLFVIGKCMISRGHSLNLILARWIEYKLDSKGGIMAPCSIKTYKYRMYY